jgi:hypothetical protein
VEFVHGTFASYIRGMKTVRIIRHPASYEVRVSQFFYFDDAPGRCSINKRMTSEEAEEAAKALARAEREKLG